MRVAVLGGGGFLGRAIGAELEGCANIDEVVFVDLRVPEPADPRWVAMDLLASSSRMLARDLDALAPDVVVNCAGVVGGEPVAMVNGNVKLVLNLVEAICAMRRPPRLVHLGSAAEYGDCPPGTQIREDRRPRPSSLYGRTKLLATDLVMTGVATRGADGIVLRVFNPIGPGAPPQSLAGNAARKIREAIDDDGVVVLGPLDARRDFVDVRDVGRAVVAACVVDQPAERIFNIASGYAVSARWVVDRLVDAAEFSGLVEERSDASERSRRVAWQEADIARARRTLGWSPDIPLMTSVADLWAEHQPCRATALLACGGVR